MLKMAVDLLLPANHFLALIISCDCMAKNCVFINGKKKQNNYMEGPGSATINNVACSKRQEEKGNRKTTNNR